LSHGPVDSQIRPFRHATGIPALSHRSVHNLLAKQKANIGTRVSVCPRGGETCVIDMEFVGHRLRKHIAKAVSPSECDSRWQRVRFSKTHGLRTFTAGIWVPRSLHFFGTSAYGKHRTQSPWLHCN